MNIFYATIICWLVYINKNLWNKNEETPRRKIN